MDQVQQGTALPFVLVVENHPRQLEIVTDFLKHEGFGVVGCSTGSGALAHMERRDLGVVVVDLQLPDMSGIHLVERFKRIRKQLPIVIHTSFGACDSADQTGQQDCFAFVKKTDDCGELIRQVYRAMRYHLNSYTAELEASVLRQTTALEETRERFDLAVRGSNDGLWDGQRLPDEPWYSPQTPVWYSSRFEELLGFEENEFPHVLESWASRLHPNDKERVFEALTAHVEHKRPYDVEYRLRTKEGGYRWYNGRGHAVWDEKGEPLRLAGSLRDITDQKRSEGLIAAQNQALNLLTSGAPLEEIFEGFIHTFENQFPHLAATIFKADHEANRLQLLGASHFSEIYKQAVDGQPIGPDAGPCGQAAYSGQAIKIEDVANDPRTAKFHDVALKAEVTACWCLPIKGDNEEILGVFSVYPLQGVWPTQKDMLWIQGAMHLVGMVFKRKKGEEALRKSQDHLRSIVDFTNDAIITVDSRGLVVFWNRAAEQMFGYTVDEMNGKPLTLVMPERFRKHHQQGIKQAEMAGGLTMEGIRFELVGLRKNGTEFPFQLSLSSWKSETGVFFTGILRDITEQKRLEQQLRQSQKMEAIGTLAGGIAHDFNNILTAMLGYTELTRAETTGNETVRRQTQEVLNAGNRAKELVKQILAFSRQSDSERKPIQLRSIVNETLKLLRPSLPTTIEVRPTLNGSQGTVLADPTQMHQVLMNLCANAEQAMRQTGGILEIQLTTVEVPRQFRANHLDLRPGRYQCLTVKDTGLGMPLEVLERVFDPFFTTKEPGEGTGMGLAVVHGIVGSHGGAVDVSSIPGKGTKFDIYLPLCDVQEEEFQPQDPIPRGEGVVLFVDDETSLAGLGREMLLALGYEAVVTTNGREALEIFHADPYRYHVVITDQTMPEMTGQALAMKILAIRPEIPIILCTGFSHVMSSEKAKKIGIKEFLMKPVGLADLAQALASVLSTTVKEKVR